MTAARTLLLLHAFPLGSGMWAPQVEAFPDWEVLAVSFPGFDGTSRVAAPSIDAFAEAALARLDAQGTRQAAVVGVSMGGYAALALMRMAPDRISRLVLADTRSSADTNEGRAARGRMIELLERDGVGAVAAEMIPKLLAASTPAQRPDVVARVRSMILSQPPGAIRDAIVAMRERPDATPLLPAIGIPALVIVGAQDTVTPPPEAEQMRARIPGARLISIPDAGHLSNIEQPVAFNQALLTFLG